jgi:hypothetical protein
MSEDARNSLIALISVTAFVAASALFLWLMKGVQLPSWTPYAVLGLNLLNLLIIIFRWKKRSPQRRKRQMARS